jgi:hypothetical protein
MDNFQVSSLRGERQAHMEWVLIFSGLIALILTLAPSVASDGVVRFTAVHALLGEPGTIRIKFSLVQPLLSLPLAWLARLAGRSEEAAVAYFNLLVFIASSAYLYKLIAERYSPRIARISLLMLGCGSMVPHHLQWYFGEVLTSAFLSIGVLSLGRRPVLATLMFGLGIANTPALIPAFSLVSAIYSWRKRNWGAITGASCAIGITVLENVAKFGSIKGSPYLASAEHGLQTILPYSGHPGFSYPLFFGVLSIVASFGKGLIFYIPGALLFFVTPLRKRLGGSALDRLLVAMFVALVIALYAKWWAWYGGGFWGPRFFLFLCFPSSLLIALAVVNGANKVGMLTFVLLVVLLSTWVGLDGYLFGQAGMDTCWANNFALESLCWYIPEFSALWRPFVTGDIGGAWDQRRALFGLWQVFTGMYMVRQLLSSSSTARTLKKESEDDPCET